jgi:acyl-CoA hydrolase
MRRLSDALHPGARVFVAGVSGESALWIDDLRADPERAALSACSSPASTAPTTALHPATRLTAFFMSPAVPGIREGRAELLPLDYPGIARHLRAMPPVDVAVAQLSLPDADGYCSAGLASDFVPLVWNRAVRRIAHLNPRLPRTSGSFRVHVSTLDIAVEADAPLLEFTEATGGALEARIGAQVAGLVRDGDTLQFGVGAVPSALASSLAAHRRLKLHSGMVSPSMRTLWEAGALDRDARITTGAALGPVSFHAFVAEQPNLWFTDVSRTHDVAAIAAIPRFIAINSAVEVDLFGQVNSERAGGVIQAGAGGLPAFARGALVSAGGRSMICLTSTARGGGLSRIVAASRQGAVHAAALPRRRGRRRARRRRAARARAGRALVARSTSPPRPPRRARCPVGHAAAHA